MYFDTLTIVGIMFEGSINIPSAEEQVLESIYSDQEFICVIRDKLESEPDGSYTRHITYMYEDLYECSLQ